MRAAGLAPKQLPVVVSKASSLCGRCSGLKHCSHIFMRWKEQAFAKSGDDCGLTIAGFYYICLCRQTGDVEGADVPVTHYISSECTPVTSLTSQGRFLLVKVD